MSEDTLHRVCERAGIATVYENFWGQPEAVPARSLQRLLAAMGIDAHDHDALRAAEARLAAQAQGLPPVHVVAQHRLQALPIEISQATPGLVAWQIEAEHGGQWQGLCEVQGGGPLRIELPADLPIGYHTLSVRAHGRCQLIVCPARCHEPEALTAGDRWWGPTVQLYALRSERNWGIGDFGDLKTLVNVAALAGASFVGLNPLHALFPHDPQRATPYSPSNRMGLNPLYLDVTAVPEFAQCSAARRRVADPAFAARLQRLREAPLVAHADVAELKHAVLRDLFDHFTAHVLPAEGPRAQAFRAFQRRHAAWLRPHALFDALQQHLHAQDPGVHGWTQWPEAYRDPSGAAVQAFERAHAAEVARAEYLQWLCDEQLAEAADAARRAGMALGLYRDVAVGVDASGSDTWQQPGLYAAGVSVGAPPETHNPAGQSWGLPPMRPAALVAAAHAPFVAMLRANMRHAGALRLDHAMALCRLFWVPEGEGSGAGTYVRYPFEDLLNILALESVRAQCLVIGEDLGNVPPGFREALAERGVRSYCPLYFQRDAAGAIPPAAQWPAQALAVVGTHDLPTLRAWWGGEDIGTRARLGLYASDAQRAEQVAVRAEERQALVAAIQHEPADASLQSEGAFDALSRAVHSFVGGVRAELAGVQIEDVIGQSAPVNVPSTTEAQHPNWRVKLELPLEALADDPRWREITQALDQARRRPVARGREDQLPLQVPRATYRIQFHAGMRFADAAAAVPYLHALGISHLYASPYLKARAGSTHGYDVTDPSRLNPDVGDEASHRQLCQALQQHDMHQLLDVVPNHMGVVQADNPWWQDVLAHGPASVHADTFDIDWSRGRLVLPVLGAPYGDVLDAGELALRFDADRGVFEVGYHAHRFAIDPASVPLVLGMTPGGEDPALGAEVEALQHLAASVPARSGATAAEAAARRRQSALLAHRLSAAVAREPRLHAWVEACVATVNQQPGVANPGCALHRLLEEQAWQLMHWRAGPDEINYRRFFDVSDLAAVQVSQSPVFERVHERVLAWLADGSVAGLRVDHPDGLSDPEAYFARLQHRHADVLRAEGQPVRPLYVVAEKILSDDEDLPETWAVQGDTGYVFSNQVNGLFVDGRQADAMQRALAAFTGHDTSFDEVLHAAKQQVMATSLAADLRWLVAHAHELAQRDLRLRDHTHNQWRAALAALAAGHTVYRTYVGARGASAIDRARLREAASSARAGSAPSLHPVIDAACALLLGDADGPRDPAHERARLHFVARWQQFTAPLQAKSMEDTAFYRYHRLISLNDVGGDPRRFGWTVEAFHAANLRRAAHTPYTLVGTSTHDSKRSEDVRARLDVLAEVPAEWRRAVTRWAPLNRRSFDDPVDAATEYLLYQTLVGVWPLQPPSPEELDTLHDRVQACMLKSVREAKQYTSWLEPDTAYEDRLRRYITHVFGSPRGSGAFFDDFGRWLGPVGRFGAWNSLSQVLLKLTSPGVPDIYQGCETWNFSLVDPDNRRAVDFAALKRQLDEALRFDPGPASVEEIDAALLDGRLKMLLTARLLGLRSRKRLLFRDGGYTPLQAHGPAAEHVVAFAREHHGDAVIVLASRLLCTLCQHGPGAVAEGVWAGTSVNLPATLQGAWRDAVTGLPVHVGSDGALALPAGGSPLPLAALVRRADPPSPTDPLPSTIP